MSAVLATFRLPQVRNQGASRRPLNWLSRVLWSHTLYNLLISLNQAVLNLNTAVKAHTVCEIWNHRTPTYNHPFGKTGLSWCQFELFVVLGHYSCLLCNDQAQSHPHSTEVSGSRSLTSKYPNTSKELFETGPRQDCLRSLPTAWVHLISLWKERGVRLVDKIYFDGYIKESKLMKIKFSRLLFFRAVTTASYFHWPKLVGLGAEKTWTKSRRKPGKPGRGTGWVVQTMAYPKGRMVSSHVWGSPVWWGGNTGLGGLASPLVVSLSRIMKEPSTLPGARSWRSASFRLMPLKNHLEGREGAVCKPAVGSPVWLSAFSPGIRTPRAWIPLVSVLLKDSLGGKQSFLWYWHFTTSESSSLELAIWDFFKKNNTAL